MTRRRKPAASARCFPALCCEHEGGRELPSRRMHRGRRPPESSGAVRPGEQARVADAMAPGGDEGRASLRKARGRRQGSIPPRDVRMGQPSALRTAWSFKLQAPTGGSETSQYPEEKKSNEISQVAASEREGAQKPPRFKRNGLERPGTQGDTPVRGRAVGARESRAGHVVSCLNTGGPSSKAEYVLATDSAPVPRGKGEKNPCEGSETESETARVQAAGARARPV